MEHKHSADKATNSYKLARPLRRRKGTNLELRRVLKHAVAHEPDAVGSVSIDHDLHQQHHPLGERCEQEVQGSVTTLKQAGPLFQLNQRAREPGHG